MKTNLIKKMIIGASALGLVGVINPYSAEACSGQDNRTFIQVISPLLKNPEIIRKDEDGKIYARFAVDLEAINDLSLHSEKYDLTSTSDAKEPFYETLEGAIRNIEQDTKYIVEFDVKNPFNPGAISGVYTLNGKKLNAYAGTRCGPASPLIFRN